MIMERENLTAGAFAERIGVAQATISHILGPRNKYPSTDVIMRLHSTYPDIDLSWLLTGEGCMSNQEQVSANLDMGYPLFAENAENADHWPNEEKNRKEIASESTTYTPKEVVKQEIIYKERPVRKITEIRIFFDDNTYEIFKPEK